MRWPIWIHLRNGVLQSPKRAINLPPAFLTPSIQEYHTSTCLTSKNHTNLRIAFGTQQNALYGSRLELSRTLSYGSRLELSRTLSYGSRLELSRTLSYGSRLELSRTLSYGSRLELSRTLSYGSRSRLKLKAKYHITFLSYNLLTKTENAAGFIQAFLL
ncbi:hypothetical protein ACO1KF_12410 [Leptospira interrogans serovar Hardjo-prajitno]|uniref:hypothetical protein n=1 Tax=Leptospira interrogans TaxID=173 RepID=UPI0002EB5958|nr:hypothetical protein [Leptospira interrogans]